ncbi:MAG: agmatine deiminase family protein [Planctomycetota bacterium]
MKSTLRTLLIAGVAAVALAAPAAANDYISTNPNDWYRFKNSKTGQEVRVEMLHDLGGWRLWSEFGGMGQTWIYTSPSHDWFWIWNGSDYTLVGNCSGNVGDARRINGPGCAANQTVTVASKAPVSTPVGNFSDATTFRFSGGSCADAGTTSVSFAKGIGVVRWSEQSIMGEVTWELVAGNVGGRTLAAQPTTPTTPTPPASSGRATAPTEHAQLESILWGCNDTYLVMDTYSGAFRALDGSGVESHVNVGSNSAASQLRYELQQAGVPMTDVSIQVVAIDTVWMRDYGPIILKKPNGDRVVADLEYFPGRDRDDAFPRAYANFRGWPRVTVDNIGYEGGNFATNGRDIMMCSNGVQWFNTHKTKSAIETEFKRKLGFDRVEWFEPLVDEGTTHVDMFMRIMSDTEALVSRYPSSHRQAPVCDAAARHLENLGYRVVRVDADYAYDEYATYSNSVLANGIALVPQYTNSTKNRNALTAYTNLGYRTFGIDSKLIIRYSGATHCMSMQVPAGN